MRTVELINGVVRLVDQRLLPREFVILECINYHQVCEAIRTLAVRGAPAIGVTAASGLALAAQALADQSEERFWIGIDLAAKELLNTRPTAVNLFWAVQKALSYATTYKGESPKEVARMLAVFAQAMADEDVAINKRMAEYGHSLIEDGAGILTHCNTGALATVDYGTALGVVRMAHEKGKKVHVYVDETRPVLQGARLTAWECVQNGIPATLITDSMAAYMMGRGKINCCFVGADRIAANGDTANKIGTYGLAILAHEHGIPFYVVAPSSTIDMQVSSGIEIEIEERNYDEVTHIGGIRMAPVGIGVANPAFDVTPSRYITGIVTERGIVYPPFHVNLTKLFVGGRQDARS